MIESAKSRRERRAEARAERRELVVMTRSEKVHYYDKAVSDGWRRARAQSVCKAIEWRLPCPVLTRVPTKVTCSRCVEILMRDIGGP